MSMNINAPVIVGGVGGSGTRVVAAILEQMGIYMGVYKNSAFDNLHFARLVSDHTPLWDSPYSVLQLTLSTFTRLNFGQLLFPQHLFCIYTSARKPRLRQSWLLIRRSRTFRSRGSAYTRWGFKNPSTFFFLRQLTQHYPDCRYIHVMRHGLDMALSSNQIQLRNWGPYFGFPEHANNGYTPSQKAEFWITVNRWALDQCASLLPGRHFILNFDNLCQHPEVEIQKLCSFLQVTPRVPMEQLKDLVITPGSTGRYQANLHLFSTEHLQAVRSFGFPVNT